MIANNLDFDWKIMSVEFYRNGYYKDINIRNHNIIQYCTMKYGGDLYRFRSKKTGRIVKKWPKLEELHTLLFNEELNNDALHNALSYMMRLDCVCNCRRSPGSADQSHSKFCFSSSILTGLAPPNRVGVA